MKSKTAAWMVGLAALGCVGTLFAHHSVSMIDVSTPVWIKGTVVKYEPISPHAMFELDERTADGQVQRWTIEGPFPGRLARILSFNGMQPNEDFLHTGDVIEVCGFRPNRNQSIGNVSASPDVSRPYIHGHVLVMPDGRMESWGPYGKVDNCVREADEPDTWVKFLDEDPLAHGFRCNSKKFVAVASTAPNGFVDAVDAALARPCD
jgi:hypothetical protein